MSLKDIAGTLTKRSPTLGINVRDKILYTTYMSLLNVYFQSVTKHIPASKEEIVVDNFKQSLTEYGFDINNLTDWKLYVDAREEWWLPHNDRLVFEELSKIFQKKNIWILYNSVFDNSDVEYSTEIYPAASVNLFGYFDILQQSNIDYKSINLDKHFIVLARRPTVKRVTLVKDLLDIFNTDIRASCGNIINTTNKRIFTRKDEAVYWQYFSDITSGKNDIVQDTPLLSLLYSGKEKKIPYEELFAPYKYPMAIDTDDKVGWDQQHLGLDNKFFSALVNVICETTEDETHPINLSEKTFKVFAWHQIPIWHAGPNHVRETRNLGFDVFDDIINHDYDLVTSYIDRKNKLIESLINFKNKYPTVDSINELRIQLWARFENNNKLLAKLVEEERILEVENLFKTGKRVST
jgi:hypothetical protein